MKDNERERLAEILILAEKKQFYVSENGKNQGQIVVICADIPQIRFYTKQAVIELNIEQESSISIREISSYSYLISQSKPNLDKVIYITQERTEREVT